MTDDNTASANAVPSGYGRRRTLVWRTPSPISLACCLRLLRRSGGRLRLVDLSVVKAKATAGDAVCGPVGRMIFTALAGALVLAAVQPLMAAIRAGTVG